MRVLVCCRDAYGHLHPMVPISQALRDRGHDVLVACGAPFRPQVEAAGLRMADSGVPLDEAQLEMRRRHPELTSLPKPQTWRFGHVMFATVVAPQAYDDLDRVVADWAPDLVLFEAMEWAAPVVAARHGLRAALVAWGPARPTAWLEEGERLVAPLWDRAGLPQARYGGMRDHPLLDVCPAVLQAPEVREHEHVVPMRHVGYDGATEPLPPWLTEPRDRPLVYVTLGTVFAGAAGVFGPVLAGLAALDLDVLVAVGPGGDPAALGPLPASVRVERYVPQRRVLALADLVVSHCGANTLLGAAAAAVPHLAVPQGADQFRNAELLAASGAGLVLTDPLGAGAVEAAAASLLSSEAAAAAARTAAAQIARRPHPSDVVPALEALLR